MQNVRADSWASASRTASNTGGGAMTPELSRCDVFTCTSRRIAPRISAQQPIVKSPPNAYGHIQLSGDPVPVVYTGEFVAEAVVPKRHVDCAILRARERDGECYPPSRSERRERKQAAKPKPCCTTLSVHISICPSSRSLPSSLIPQGRPGSNRIGRCRSCGRDTRLSAADSRALRMLPTHTSFASAVLENRC